MAAVLRDGRRAGHADHAGPAPPFAGASTPSFGFPRSNMPPFNITGLADAGAAVRFSPPGLPLSLQLAGRPFDEATVLRVGHAYEQATAGIRADRRCAHDARSGHRAPRSTT